VGVTHDLTIGAFGIGGGYFLSPVQGYVSMETMEWLEQPADYNHLLVAVSGDSDNLAHIDQVAARVREEVEGTGLEVFAVRTRASDDHPNSAYVEAISGVLILLGLLVVFLSGFLITNTLSALLNQQVQQIGVMKTVGGRQYQIIGIYTMLIFIFGVLAFVIAYPLADRAGFWLVNFLAEQVNFSSRGYRLVAPALVIELLIALIVPQVAAFLPIFHGTRITVNEAISGSTQGSAPGRKGLIDRVLGAIRGLSRPMLISLRNAFRRKGRLALTLVTLTLGGAIFIATFSVQISLENYIKQLGRYFLADVNLTFDRPYRLDEIQGALADMPVVGYVEGWTAARSEVLMQDDAPGESVSLLGPPASSRLVEPIMISGRWIRPGDKNAIVLSERFSTLFPNMKVGDALRLRVNGKKTEWVVAGFFQLAGKSSGYLAYTSYEYLSSLVNQPNKATTFRVLSDRHNMTVEEQKAFGREIEAHLSAKGYRLTDVTAGLFLTEASSDGLTILTGFLLIMASLTALVGSIGLMGTMSMNVLERTREIGIMRSIGATDRTLMSLVIVEGMIIGLVSWILGSLLAFPISKVLSDTVSIALFDSPSNFVITPTGFIIWLAAVLLLSILASVMPARNAARLTIREVLAYE
jgi:putative ABC transport system permease protein